MMKYLIIATFLCSQIYVFSQKSEEVEIVFPDGKITGELTHVSKDNVVLIIPGSGPTDRDGNNSMMNNDGLKMLSDSLVARGVSTLRIDKRGVGNSVFPDLKEENITINTFISDVNKWLNLLTVKMYKNIYVAGHSEGSLIGMVASQNRVTVKGFISIAGPGSSADSILLSQLSMLPPESLNQIANYLDTLKRGKLLTNVPKSFHMLFRPSAQPYMMSWVKYSPTDEIAKLKRPVLILNGDSDLQVGIEEAEKLQSHAQNGTLVVLEKTNHVLKVVNSIVENKKAYSDPKYPLNDKISDIIVDFINKK